jgi:hypothetical protein
MRFLSALGVFVSFFLLYSCTGISDEIKAKYTSTSNDVFQEIRVGYPVPEGFADIIIMAQIKTPLKGYFAYEAKDSFDRQPQYPFLFNIDGQATLWNVDGKKENTPLYDTWGSRTHDGGEGIRYVLEKKIRVAAGTHGISFALPGNKYYKKVEVAVKDGEQIVLEFKPLYRNDRWLNQVYTPNRWMNQDDTRDIQDYQVFLKEISTKQHQKISRS